MSPESSMDKAQRLAPHIAGYGQRLTPTERVLYVSLNPDQIALEGLEKICLIDPSHPEQGWRLKSDDELPHPLDAEPPYGDPL